MTQTIAQNILINNRANNRKSNYGQHTLGTFTDLDKSINNNITYNTILSKLNALDSVYDTTLEELNVLISDARQVSLKLQQDIDLLALMPTYTYVNPVDKAPYITLINTINTLLEDCNKVINNINNRTVSNIDVYTNQVILDSISLSVNALISKEWLASYLGSLPKIPKIKPPNATLICNNNGEITWQ
jgi:hypothetical protein